MSDDTLDRLFDLLGFSREYQDAFGRGNAPSADDRAALIFGLGIDVDDPEAVRVAIADLEAAHLKAAQRDAVAEALPESCYLPPEIAAGGKLWGISLQLYTLRSTRNWGIGDYSDLALVASLAGELGADLIGLNPLHARSLTRPLDCSPYSPVSRLCLDTLAIDVEAIADLTVSLRTEIASAEFQNRLAPLRAAAHVDYAAVAAVKLEMLDTAFRDFESGGTEARRRAFAAYLDEADAAIRNYAEFEARRRLILDQDGGYPAWWDWPPEIANDAALAAECRFQMYLQFIAIEQYAAAALAAQHAGMRIGFYRDLAVAAAFDGAEAWATPALASRLTVGAPPDAMSPEGQNWGMPAPDPRALREIGYAPFKALLAANMVGAGAFRIDHAMSLQRLFVIPPGRPGASGTYLAYPFETMVGLLCTASQRHHCMVIGEDLGVVPSGFREAMADRKILSYKVLAFERYADGALHAPADYPYLSVAMAATHDLPTLAGYWQGRDIEARYHLGLMDEQQMLQAIAERSTERRRLLTLLDWQGALPSPAPDPEDSGAPIEALVDALHLLIARAGSALALAQLDDILLETEAVNLPGTSTEYPNWRRKLSLNIEDDAFVLALRKTAAIFRSARGAI